MFRIPNYNSPVTVLFLCTYTPSYETNDHGIKSFPEIFKKKEQTQPNKFSKILF